MCVQLSSEINKLSAWFKTNRLSLNVSKTNCMIFGRPDKPEHHRVYIDNIVIERVNCNTFLVVLIHSKLSCSDHVSYIRHKMSKNLSVMHRVKWLLNKSAIYMIYCTLVLPYISYCCDIWGNTYKTRIQPLYIIQKRAIRLCNHHEYRLHSKPAFFNLKTLIIADLVLFKSIHGIDLLHRVLDIHCQIDSSQCLAQLTPARVGIARSVHVQLGTSPHVIR